MAFRWIVIGVFLLAYASASGTESSLATMTANLRKRIAASGRTRVLIDTKLGCDEPCAAMNRNAAALLRDELAQVEGAFEIVRRAEVEDLLRKGGFLPIDYHLSATRRLVAMQLDALLLTGSLRQKRDGVELRVELQRGPELKTFYKTKAVLPVQRLQASLDKICEANICVAGVGGISVPTCSYCPNPSFTDEAVSRRVSGNLKMLVTVTSQGKAEDLTLVSRLGYGLDEQSLKSVATWRFEPAKDEHGQPIATRVVVEVSFRQLD